MRDELQETHEVLSERQLAADHGVNEALADLLSRSEQADEGVIELRRHCDAQLFDLSQEHATYDARVKALEISQQGQDDILTEMGRLKAHFAAQRSLNEEQEATVASLRRDAQE